MTDTVESKEAGKLSVLKGHLYDVAKPGKQADQYTQTTKAIGEYVGRVYGREMLQLVLHLKECKPSEPEYPTGNAVTERDKAVWGKQYDLYLKKQEQYEDYKAKVFTIVLGQCTKAMKNKVEGTTGFESEIAVNYDVVKLLQLIKSIAYGSNDKIYPSKQATDTLKQLMNARQQDGESQVDYYKWYVSIVEQAESTYGKVVPVEIAKKDSQYQSNHSTVEDGEWNKLLAYLFMDGADKNAYGPLLDDLQNDYALGMHDIYPDTVEDALQVLIMYHRKSVTGSQMDEDDEKKVLLAQSTHGGKKNIKCWLCGIEGHVKKDCPHMKSDTGVTSNLQVPYWAGRAGHWSME